MKTILAILAATILSLNTWAEYSALDEAIYSLTRDCNEYAPWQSGFYVYQCD